MIFFSQDGTDKDPMDLWLSEIEENSIDLHEHPEAPVRPLKNDDVLYYWGKGLCPVGNCRPPTYGCNEETGLCFTPIPTTTTTTTPRPIICHPLGCWGYPF
ncbi:hypothetical protein Y032_0030g2166 [Ancylostoma ceylanicum]|uniref:Uncharacterized protein n=1 Tax=Ancylostoma ceylanicum TaxID=53326 RepID=A0A016UQD3_9BILA|nr:hypothetical protein Y032_0030g2166 [Ancylostoma ceylanicum]